MCTWIWFITQSPVIWWFKFCSCSFIYCIFQLIRAISNNHLFRISIRTLGCHLNACRWSRIVIIIDYKITLTCAHRKDGKMIGRKFYISKSITSILCGKISENIPCHSIVWITHTDIFSYVRCIHHSFYCGIYRFCSFCILKCNSCCWWSHFECFDNFYIRKILLHILYWVVFRWYNWSDIWLLVRFFYKFCILRYINSCILICRF